MNEENVKITVEIDDITKVVELTRENIKVNGKKATIADCAHGFEVCNELRDLFVSYAGKIVYGKE